MSIQSQFDREEQQIEDDLENGIITSIEYNKQLRDLRQGYRECMDEACDNAYDNERNNW